MNEPERDLRALVALLPSDFATVAPDQTADGRRRGRCVEATRLITAVMRHLGHEAWPLACDVLVANRLAAEMISRRVPVTQWPPAAMSVGAMCDLSLSAPILQEPGRRKGFGGHLVTVGDGWFCDVTVQQFHRPDDGIVVGSAIMGPYRAGASAEIDLPFGGRLAYWWRREVRSYRTTPAWRQDVDPELVRVMASQVRGGLRLRKTH